MSFSASLVYPWLKKLPLMMLVNVHNGRLDQPGIIVFAHVKRGASSWAPGTDLPAVVIVLIERNSTAGDRPINRRSIGRG